MWSWATTIPSGTKPCRIDATPWALRSRSPAATTRTADTATCAATSTRWRAAAARHPGPGRPREGRRPDGRHEQQAETDGRPRRPGDGHRPRHGARTRARRVAERRQLRQRRQDGVHPTQGHERGQPPGRDQHRQLRREATDEGAARRPQHAPHRQLVGLLGPAGQHQQDQVAARGQEEDTRDDGQHVRNRAASRWNSGPSPRSPVDSYGMRLYHAS